VVIDESGYWRMDPSVPLVIPEVNPQAIARHRGIISSPNCSTTQLVVALKPLHDAARVTRVVVSTYQATSGAGVAGQRDLESGTRAHLESQDFRYETFAHPIAFNLIPQIGSPKHQGYTSEEMKMVYETRKILGEPDLLVCPTCVRVPVSNCHSESILVETQRKLTVDEARNCLPPRRGSSSSTTWPPRAIPCRSIATAATRSSWAAFAKTSPAPTAWRSGASATTCARVLPPMPCRLPSCWCGRGQSRARHRDDRASSQLQTIPQADCGLRRHALCWLQLQSGQLTLQGEFEAALPM